MSLRKINEDARLRPFLSSMFDPQAYIRTVIKDGRSEECFDNIVSCIDDINVEIKSYISQHKDDLMSGMQDVATLADRYNNLSALSQKLHQNIARLKKEAMESYELVNSRTLELERIHETSAILNQLKQFAHAKSQLDQYLADKHDNDIRNLSAAAKTISDLEKLLQNPKLLEISFVNDSAASIKLFGQNIRLLAQEKLTKSIQDKNQAATASSLQVFYNLESLPEIILIIIDTIVKQTVDSARETLDLKSINQLYQDFMNKTPASSIPVTGSSNSLAAAIANPLASKRNISNDKVNNMSGNTGSSTNPMQPVTLSQLRIAIRDVAHKWSMVIQNYSLQIHVLQRVVMKKEDPTTHEKFLEVLRKVIKYDNSEGELSSSSNFLLSNGQLLELFWERLALSLHDVSAEKLKTFPVAASRSYPYLRRAAGEVVSSLQAWRDLDAKQDGTVGGNFGAIFMSSLGSGETPDDLLSDDVDGSDPAIWDSGGIFGSLQWTQVDLLGTQGLVKFGTVRSKKSQFSGENAGSIGFKRDNSGVKGKMEGFGDHRLVKGLQPVRDLFLVNCFGRMSAPILQMFPEVEGYTAAVPSKRDLQALVKSIQGEFVGGIMEGDLGLILSISKEFIKTIKLMCTKVEGMVMNNQDTWKITSQNQFARNSAQEHNGQLVILLIQLKDALLKIPDSIIKQTQSSSDSLLNHDISSVEPFRKDGNSSVEGFGKHPVLIELNRSMELTGSFLDELAQRQILDSIVTLLTGYVKTVLLGIHKEGVSTASPKTQSEDSVECSFAVQTLVKQFPIMLQSHLRCLPRCSVVDSALEEVCVRTMHAYVSVAALLRPVNEATKLRTAKELSTIDAMLAGLYDRQESDNMNQTICPVLQEFKAFRRLLFREVNKNPDKTSTAPSRLELVKLPYFNHLRPSTLLGYLASSAPAQLPSIFENSNNQTSTTPTTTANNNFNALQNYINEITELKLLDKNHDDKKKLSVRKLYTSESLNWKDIENEKKCWEALQGCLDTFFQRISVAEVKQKQEMREWYESIMDIGSFYFTK